MKHATLLISALLGGCAAEKPVPPRVGLANPASVACGKAGGSLEIASDASGGAIGLCHLPDGRVCEEWALFRDQTCLIPPGTIRRP